MRQNYQQRRPALASLSIGLLCALLSSFIGSASAQTQISEVELCACNPRVYELTFDFSLECEPINVDLESGGIADATCLVTGFDNLNVTDLVPVAVSSVQLIEIGEDGGPAAVAQEQGDFRDGSTVTYTSISFEGAVAPRAFQLRALGRNAAGDPLVLQWAVTYSNNCGVWPVLEVNDSIGWTIFTGLAEPLALICPARPTESPTFAPTVSSESPSDPPTVPPTIAPTPLTPEPTQIPSASPTDLPSVSPSDPPTVTPGVPTAAPTTPAPTTEAPTGTDMSYSFSYSFDWEFDSMDVEFGRDDTKPPCRKRKVRRVRKVRKLRPAKLKKEDIVPRQGDVDSNTTAPVPELYDDGNITAPAFDGVSQVGDESISADEAIVSVFDSEDEMEEMSVESEDEMIPEEPEYEYVDEVVEVEVCEDDLTDPELPSLEEYHDKKSSKGKGGYYSSKGSNSSGKGYSASKGSSSKGTSSSKGMSLKSKDSKGQSKKSIKSSSKGNSSSKGSKGSYGGSGSYDESVIFDSDESYDGEGSYGSKGSSSKGSKGSGSKSSYASKKSTPSGSSKGNMSMVSKGGSSASSKGKGSYSGSKGSKSSSKLSKKSMPAESMSRLRSRTP